MQPTEWEKLFTNDMASMELISKTLKIIILTMTEKQTTQFKTMQKT